jgi:hypothetical protein
MKKLLALTLSLASIVFVATSAEAKVKESSVSSTTTIASNSLQRQWRYRNRGNNRVARTFTQTRLVRYGRQVYRETYLVRYLPNGRTQARLISRVRVR